MKLRELLNLLKELSVKHNTSTPMICGGTPRDRFMKKLDNVSDIDITTGDESVKVLSKYFYDALKEKYNVMYKINKDGHTSLYIGNLKIDFSSNFVVNNIDEILSIEGITNPIDLQKEIYSRDFTCNALLLDLDLRTVVDVTKSGITDIQNKIIKTCLTPEITLNAYRNRVARSVYLACKLDFDIDESIIDYVSKNPSLVKFSTPKVMKEKIDFAFNKNPEKASSLVTKMNLWNYIPITDAVYPYYVKYGKK